MTDESEYPAVYVQDTGQQYEVTVYKSQYHKTVFALQENEVEPVREALEGLTDE